MLKHARAPNTSRIKDEIEKNNAKKKGRKAICWEATSRRHAPKEQPQGTNTNQETSKHKFKKYKPNKQGKTQRWKLAKNMAEP